MNQFDPQAYGPVFAPLLSTDRRRPLGDGEGDSRAKPALHALTIDSAFSHAKVADRDMAACCISGTWLLHDFLDQSHAISQGIETAEGSFWHAIMHRREADFANSKYWLRRVGRHAVFEELGQRAAELAAIRGAERAVTKLRVGGAWEPFAFVDMCEAAVRGRGADEELCRDIQQAEWELLFAHCYRAALGA